MSALPLDKTRPKRRGQEISTTKHYSWSGTTDGPSIRSSSLKGQSGIVRLKAGSDVLSSSRIPEARDEATMGRISLQNPGSDPGCPKVDTIPEPDDRNTIPALRIMLLLLPCSRGWVLMLDMMLCVDFVTVPFQPAQELRPCFFSSTSGGLHQSIMGHLSTRY